MNYLTDAIKQDARKRVDSRKKNLDENLIRLIKKQRNILNLIQALCGAWLTDYQTDDRIAENMFVKKEERQGDGYATILRYTYLHEGLRLTRNVPVIDET